MKRGLCVSVGGSQGSYAGGIVEHKIRSGIKYDHLYGSSVGSLIIPFASTGDYVSLKEAFSNTTMDHIFTLNPFKINGQTNGIFKYSMNYVNIFKSLFINKNSSLGDSTKLRTDIIPNFFPSKENILNGELSIMVTNISTGKLEVKKYKDCDHDKFMDWIWASTCAPPFMSIAKIDDHHYMDGGILSQVPIKNAIMDGCDEIDIILLSKEKPEWHIEHIRNFLHSQIKILLLMMNRLQNYEVDLGYLSAISYKEVILNFHYTDRRLTNNSLIFEPEVMKKWWEEGYKYSENDKSISYLIDGRTSSYKLLD